MREEKERRRQDRVRLVLRKTEKRRDLQARLGRKQCRWSIDARLIASSHRSISFILGNRERPPAKYTSTRCLSRANPLVCSRCNTRSLTLLGPNGPTKRLGTRPSSKEVRSRDDRAPIAQHLGLHSWLCYWKKVEDTRSVRTLSRGLVGFLSTNLVELMSTVPDRCPVPLFSSGPDAPGKKEDSREGRRDFLMQQSLIA